MWSESDFSAVQSLIFHEKKDRSRRNIEGTEYIEGRNIIEETEYIEETE